MEAQAHSQLAASLKAFRPSLILSLQPIGSSAELSKCRKQRGGRGRKASPSPHPRPTTRSRRLAAAVAEEGEEEAAAGHGIVVDPGGRSRDAEGPRGTGQRPQQDPERHLQEPPGPQAVHHPGRRERARPQGAGAAKRRGERVQADRAGAGQAGPCGGQGQRQEAHRVHLRGAEANGTGAEGSGGQAEQQEGIGMLFSFLLAVVAFGIDWTPGVE